MDMPRIWRHSGSAFGKARPHPNDLEDETVTAAAAYTEQALADIARCRFDSFWVHGQLHHIVKSSVFPEFGPHSEAHLAAMRGLIERAARHGLRVYIYMQPPRGINADDPFWKAHPDVGGEPQEWTSDRGEPMVVRPLCTSMPQVQASLRDSAERLARELPGLGGVILITASEYCSHCYGRFNYVGSVSGDGWDGERRKVACPRCAQRHPADVVVEIVRLIRDGIRAVSPDVQVIAWNWSWSWYEADPSPSIIQGLPRDVILLCDFERGGFKRILGKERMVDEYSLSYPGPSERFLGSFYVARRAGLRTIAKLQIGATHELATVANLPLIGNLYEKARAMRRLGIRGYMGTWNFGNRITANPAAFNRFFLAKRLPLKRRAMTDFARDYLPGCDAASAVEAWRQFVRAMDYYPFSIPFLYGSCVNWSLGYPLKPGPAADTPSGRAWLLDKRGDQLKHGAFSLAKVIHALGRVARLWRPGCVLFDKAVAACSCAEARLERDNAWMAYHSFRSAWNSYRVFRLRQAWSDTMLPEYRRIIADELENVEAALPIVQRDPRFGFHIEAHGYMYDAASVARKARSLRRQLAQG